MGARGNRQVLAALGCLFWPRRRRAQFLSATRAIRGANALGIFLLGGSLRISVAGAAAAVISWWGFAQLAAGLASGSRAGARLGRFAEKDAFRYRREMAASSVRMIRDHP